MMDFSRGLWGEMHCTFKSVFYLDFAKAKVCSGLMYEEAN